MLGIACGALFPTEWYISNAGGMAIEPAFSRSALRHKYALSVEDALVSQLPERLLEYYDGTYGIELRTLYEDGEISRLQWSFRDEAGKVRLVSVFVDDGSGFIEFFTPEELILESHQINAGGSDFYNLYTYNENFLIKAEAWRFIPARKPEESEETGEAEDMPAPVETSELASGPADAAIDETVDRTELLWTDYYRYNRSRSLRNVERRFSQGSAGEEMPVLMQFPRLSLSAVNENEFVRPMSMVSSEFFEDVILNSGDRILYTTDSRGRILSEVRRDEQDRVLGEIINTWSGDRLVSVLWKAEGEERLVEYEYNANGDRIFERNIRNGVLERTVYKEGEREVEELYMNGEVILHAIWENGRKISEERVRQGGLPPAPGGE
jgi:hypothetical protein